MPVRTERQPGPPHILRAARWEYDKNPETFFNVLCRLADENLPFRLSVIGEQFREQLAIFDQAHDQLADRIVHWGYLDSRDEYEKALARADIVVSTADHEFFGVGIVEAVAAGAFPLLPRRLAYPEVFGECDNFFYDGTAVGLENALRHLLRNFDPKRLWREGPDMCRQIIEPYYWDNLAPRLDDGLDEVLAG
jgi:glycosyltransferase involved in cell wall biosynthesis